MRIEIPFIIGILVLGAVAFAEPVPPPTIIVQISPTDTNPNVGNVEILIEDLSRISQSHMLYTNEKGDILVNIDQYFPNWVFGDSIRATIVDCAGKPECVQTQTVSSDPNIYGAWFKFGVTEKFCPSATCEPETITNTQTEYLKCEGSTELGYGETYGPDNCGVTVSAPGKPGISDYVVEIIVGVIASLAVGAGVGLKVTRYGTKTHYHPGIVSYHSPDILHKSPYTHRKGEHFPKYVKDADGKYRYEGG